MSEIIEPDPGVPALNEFKEVFNNPDEFDKRVCCDKAVNRNGREVLQFCSVYSLGIVNGRVGSDKQYGQYTYISTNGCSVTDYCIVDFGATKYIKGFEVAERTESLRLPLTVLLQPLIEGDGFGDTDIDAKLLAAMILLTD